MSQTTRFGRSAHKIEQTKKGSLASTGRQASGDRAQYRAERRKEARREQVGTFQAIVHKIELNE